MRGGKVAGRARTARHGAAYGGPHLDAPSAAAALPPHPFQRSAHPSLRRMWASSLHCAASWAFRGGEAVRGFVGHRLITVVVAASWAQLRFATP